MTIPWPRSDLTINGKCRPCGADSGVLTVTAYSEAMNYTVPQPLDSAISARGPRASVCECRASIETSRLSPSSSPWPNPRSMFSYAVISLRLSLTLLVALRHLYSHTNHNQNKKAHRNGIKSPKSHRTLSLKGVRNLSGNNHHEISY